MNVDRLNARLRAIKLSGLILICLTAVSWIFLGMWRVAISGLLLGELGGAFVVISMIRQGHHNDNTGGASLFASGIVGMFTRLVVLAIVMVVAEKWRHIFNPYTALIGYLLGFVFIFVGLYGFAKNHETISKTK